MSTPEETVEPFDEEQILRYTHGIRKKVVTSLLKNGEAPSDLKEMSVLAGYLSDMDRSALTNKRIKTDDDANKNAAGGAAIIAKLLQGVRVIDTINNSDPGPNFKSPTIDDSVSLPSVSDGELQQGTSTQTYTDFESKHFPPSEVNK